MKAHVDFDWPTRLYKVYLYQEYANTRHPLVVIEGGTLAPGMLQLEVGQIMKPTLSLEREVYEALQTAMIGEAIDQDDALKDTRAIRDRLLAMVESEWQSRQLEKH